LIVLLETCSLSCHTFRMSVLAVIKSNLFFLSKYFFSFFCLRGKFYDGTRPPSRPLTRVENTPNCHYFVLGRIVVRCVGPGPPPPFHGVLHKKKKKEDGWKTLGLSEPVVKTAKIPQQRLIQNCSAAISFRASLCVFLILFFYPTGPLEDTEVKAASSLSPFAFCLVSLFPSFTKWRHIYQKRRMTKPWTWTRCVCVCVCTQQQRTESPRWHTWFPFSLFFSFPE
jgi:hypothetical protein